LEEKTFLGFFQSVYVVLWLSLYSRSCHLDYVVSGVNQDMRSKTRIFVSYTRRDGQVTAAHLARLSESLGEVCLPFIHFVHSSRGHWEQLRVIIELVRSHVILLIDTLAVLKSPWVTIELLLSRLLLIPIVKIPVERLTKLTENDGDNPAMQRNTTQSGHSS